jgi:hypothetical protein
MPRAVMMVGAWLINIFVAEWVSGALAPTARARANSAVARGVQAAG